MHRKLLSTFAILIALATSGISQETSVLFVGNSHTFYNDLPGLFEGLATSGFHDVYVGESTVGGSTLSFHTSYASTLNEIQERDWDHVVLQEHSLFPVIPHWRDESFYPSARFLDSLITDTGSNTAFYLTQGWENAEGPYCIEDYCSPKFDGYFSMQADATAAYRNISNELGALLVPAGEAWSAALSVNPDLELWAFDGYHPSLEGSYLSACTFYAHIFEESPYGLEFFGGLNLQTALFYQQIAWQVTGASEEAPSLLACLYPAYPNPFNPSTEIRFELDLPARVHLAIFNIAGRQVRELYTERFLDAGEHGYTWRGRDDEGNALPSGIYLLRLQAGEVSREAKLTLLK
ncbi:T9SS type A sorting domain-containing protein [bacterium]|nr:T9SS type A sorting domain-containing protein [bacterium]